MKTHLQINEKHSFNYPKGERLITSASLTPCSSPWFKSYSVAILLLFLLGMFLRSQFLQKPTYALQWAFMNFFRQVGHIVFQDPLVSIERGLQWSASHEAW